MEDDQFRVLSFGSPIVHKAEAELGVSQRSPSFQAEAYCLELGYVRDILTEPSEN